MSKRNERIDYRTFKIEDIVRHPSNIQTQFQHLTLLDTSVDQINQKDNTMIKPSEDAIEIMQMLIFHPILRKLVRNSTILQT